jgi:hypothetical protein
MTQFLAKLRGSSEQMSPCCNSMGVITADGKVVCQDCGRYRCSLSAAAAALEAITEHFGAPTQPLIIRDASAYFKDESNGKA